ncbi:hypothetical protein NN561_015734 [Cricetulus griseus]
MVVSESRRGRCFSKKKKKSNGWGGRRRGSAATASWGAEVAAGGAALGPARAGDGSSCPGAARPVRTEDSSPPLCSLPQRPGGRRPAGEGAGRTPAIGRDSTWGARRRRPPAVGNSCFSPCARRGAGSPGWGSGAVAGVELERAGGGLALVLPAPTGQSRKDPRRLGQGPRALRTPGMGSCWTSQSRPGELFALGLDGTLT